MKEHLFPFNSFIGGWYITEKSCELVKDYFKSNLHLQYKGSAANGNIDIDKVDDSRITINVKDLDNHLSSYRNELSQCLKNYLNKYPEFNNVAKFNLNEKINIQYYKPGGGYKLAHFENDGRENTYKRYLVFMTYLNNLQKGGTIFKYQKITTPAIKGLTLIWPAYVTHVHQSQISSDEEKYIITGWISFN